MYCAYFKVFSFVGTQLGALLGWKTEKYRSDNRYGIRKESWYLTWVRYSN